MSIKLQFSEMLANILSVIHQGSKGSALDNACLDAMEYVIDGTDPKIRFVNRYKKRLYQAIVRSLEYAEQLVDQIPQVPEISSKKYVSNQYFYFVRLIETTTN